MIRIYIQNRYRAKPYTIDVPKDIPIYLMNKQFCEVTGRERTYKYFYHGQILDYDNNLSDYAIRDGDIIGLNYNNQEKVEGLVYASGFHICPYGCGRQIPDGYKGCTELLQAQPNYFG